MKEKEIADSLQKYADQILKTGFDLEFRTGRSLQGKGWSVISNKYYLDDTEERVREIDLVAYKVRKVQHVNVFTSLVISCKKSTDNTWVLLSRKPKLNDPNVNLSPVHHWTNDKALRYEGSLPEFSKAYHDYARSEGHVTEALRQPDADIFAFQEMDRTKGSPQNDKAIFGAVTSLMKAQAYELQALPQRKKAPCVYQFNLISVLDGDLVRLDFEDDKIRPIRVDTEHYIARYIVQKKETFARVHFVRLNGLDAVLEDYDRLHKANCDFFNTRIETFYQNAISDWRRQMVFEEDFLEEVRWRIESASRRRIGREVSAKKLGLSWQSESSTLFLTLDDGEEYIDALNSDTALNVEVATALKKVFRFSGNFKFQFDDIPF